MVKDHSDSEKGNPLPSHISEHLLRNYDWYKHETKEDFMDTGYRQVTCYFCFDILK